MGEVLGVGTTHVPYLMSAPENLLRFRKNLCQLAESLSGAASGQSRVAAVFDAIWTLKSVSSEIAVSSRTVGVVALKT